jgi:peptide/bleomycin uptake transporter
MYREYFCHADWRYRCGSWGGVILTLILIAYSSWISYFMNQWNADFFDTLQNGSKAIGDGDVDPAVLQDFQDKIWTLIVQYLWILTPLVVVSPLANFLVQCWTFYWRLSLVRSYLAAWDTSVPPIEGAAQRVHEDTGRFANGLNSLATSFLNAILTLLIFSPILYDIGGDVRSPFVAFGIDLGDWWVLAFSWTFAIGGLGVSVLIGRKLIGLEINNQKVEAVLRRDLVVLETTPEKITREPGGVARNFEPTIANLVDNYIRLYTNFTQLNAWLSGYEMIIGLAPFVLCAPLIFAQDPEERITLGTLTKLDNAFAKVFGALSTVSQNWATVNDWISTIIRLREFESMVYHKRPLEETRQKWSGGNFPLM